MVCRGCLRLLPVLVLVTRIRRRLHEQAMSFTFNWPRFSDQFHFDAIQMLNTALNKGNKPPIIADKIEVVELEMGSQVCLVNPHPYTSY